MDEPASLERAYRDAVYEVDLSTGPVTLRIGHPPPQGVPCPLAIITAWNPGTARPGEAENQRANRRLEAEIAGRGLAWFPARGRDATASHVEPSFAIPGIHLEGALALAREFRQAAIVYVNEGRVSLAWC